VYKGHFTGQAGRVDEVEECGTMRDELARPLVNGRDQFSYQVNIDVLRSPQNLNHWVGEHPSCPLCSTRATLRHILTGSVEISLRLQGKLSFPYNVKKIIIHLFITIPHHMTPLNQRILEI